MKLAIVSSYPPQKCGVGILTRRLVESFTKLKVDLEVITFKGYKYNDKRIKPIIEKNNLFSYINAFYYIRKNKFDTVLLEHEYTIFNQKGLFVLLPLLKMFDIKTDIVFHTGVPSYSYLKQIPFKLAHLIFSFVSMNTFVHTNEVKSKLKFLGNKVKVVPIPIPIAKQKKIISKKPGRTMLLCFGFITYDKGTDIACKAISKMKDVELFVVGAVYPRATKSHFDCLNKIKGYAKKYKNIHLINRFVSEKEKKDFILKSDFVVLPYRLVNQSAILTEIWSLNKIPIGSNIDALKEEIGDNKYGILFKNEDIIDLRRKIYEIINNKVKQKEIIKNIKELVKRRNFDNIAKLYLKLIKK